MTLKQRSCWVGLQSPRGLVEAIIEMGWSPGLLVADGNAGPTNGRARFSKVTECSVLGSWDGSDGIGGWGIADLGSNGGGEWASRWAIDHGTGWGGRGHWRGEVGVLPWGRVPLDFSKMLRACIHTTVQLGGFHFPGRLLMRESLMQNGGKDSIHPGPTGCAHQGLCPVPISLNNFSHSPVPPYPSTPHSPQVLNLAGRFRSKHRGM